MNPGSEDCLPCTCFRKFSLEIRMEWGQRRGQRRRVGGDSGERGWSHMNVEEWEKLSTSWGRRTLSEWRHEREDRMSREGKYIFRVRSLSRVKEYWKNKVIDKIKRN